MYYIAYKYISLFKVGVFSGYRRIGDDTVDIKVTPSTPRPVADLKKSAATGRGGPSPFQKPSSYPSLLVVADSSLPKPDLKARCQRQ